MKNEPDKISGEQPHNALDDALIPDKCENMRDVRAGVDAVDQQIIALLSQRFGYMRAAARIKPERSAVRDEARKAQVIDNAKKAAWESNVPIGFVSEFWDQLVETSISYEMEHWDNLRKQN